MQQGLHLLKLILNDRPFLYNQISEIRMDSHTGYVLYTKTGGVPVRIGQHDLRLKLRCLEAILNHLIQKNTLKGSRYIDLRFRNQVIVGDEV